jgi:hypothetical protein
MASLLADEDFDFHLVEALRAHGHSVVRHQEVRDAPRGEPDTEVLYRAATLGRILLTHNRRDFVRIHRGGTTHAGILTVPQGRDALDAAEQIDGLLVTTPSFQDRLFRVNRPPAGILEG